MRYSQLEERILALADDNTEVFSIGESTFLHNIYAVRVGDPRDARVVFQGGIHAREWITTALVVRLAEHYKGIAGRGVYFLPCTNPDGVRLALEGADWIDDTSAREYLLSLNGSSDFALYKANGRGVDLNTNFDADWGKGDTNVRSPASANYIGSYPASERETQALVRFTREVAPRLTLSYHSKGEVVYYGFSGQSAASAARGRAMADRFSQALGYEAIYTTGSAGGYKDWCIRELDIPAFTIEVGHDNLSHPIGLEHLEDIALRNVRVFDRGILDII